MVAPSLRVSADVVPSGYVKVTALDEGGREVAEGELVTTTVTDGPIRWKDGFSFDALKGKRVKLRFELRDAKLYSFSFGD